MHIVDSAKPLDRSDLGAVSHHRKGEAGTRRLSIHEDGTRAANTVLATQMCAGFKILRDSCGGDPFEKQKNILAVCNSVENRPAVKKSVGDKFDKAPF